MAPSANRGQRPAAKHLAHGGKWIRRERRFAIYLRDQFKCVYCEKELTDEQDGGELTIDHLNEQGGNHETNLVTCCKTCNTAKGGMSVEAFASRAAIRRVEHAISLPVNVVAGREFLNKRTRPTINLEELPTIFLPAKQMAQVGLTTDKKLAELAEQGKIPKSTASGYDALLTATKLIQFERDSAPRLADLLAEHKLRREKAEADNAEIETAERLGSIRKRIESMISEYAVENRKRVSGANYIALEHRKRLTNEIAETKLAPQK